MNEEITNQDPQARRPRLNRLPYDELVEVVEDPHRGGKLVGRRGEIDGHAQTGERPYRYWIKIKGIAAPLPFARSQLKPTGIPRIAYPPSPWTVEQIEAFIANPPKNAGIYWQVLAKHARTNELATVLRESSDPWARYQCCYVFHWTRAKSAREAVLAALFDPDKNVRRVAADTYSKVGRPEDWPIVIAAYKLDHRESVRRDLIFALGEIQSQGAAPFLIDLLRRGIERSEVIDSLGELSGPEVKAALAAELEGESDPWWRRSIMSAIAFVDARARRTEIEASGGQVPRPLTAEQIEQIVLNPPSDIEGTHAHLLIYASVNELRRAFKQSSNLTVRNAAEFALERVKYRQKRGY